MNDDMDALVGQTARVTDADVSSLLLPAEADLMEEIMSTPILESVPTTPEPVQRRRPGRRLAVLAGAAAVTASVLLVVQSGNDAGPVWATEVLEVAEAAPRLLLDDPGWQIRGAKEFTAEYGEMTFTDGARELELRWLPVSEQPAVGSDPAADLEESITVVGREATLRRYDPNPGPTAEADLDPMHAGSAFVTLWDHRDHRVVVTGWGFVDQPDYEAALLALREVDDDAWLTAMPASVVSPDDSDAVVAEMLAGVPVPTGFDPVRVTPQDGVRDRYALGAHVTGAVVCGWIDQWVTATDSGDAAGVDEAAAALASSHDWAVLQEMDAVGGYPFMVWAYAESIVNDRTLPDGIPVDEVVPAGSVEGDTVFEEPVEVYKLALGCDLTR